MDSKRKILMISPARKREPGERFVFEMAFLNLPYLAAATPAHYDVEIFDEEHQVLDFDIPAQLVVLTAQTPVAPRAYAIAAEFRKRGVPTVMGGVHASTLPEEALEHVDSVVVGEGEFVWPTVLSDVEENRLQRIYPSGAHHCLKGLVWPRRDLLNPKFYLPLTMVETTRGCPHQCDFCEVSEFFGHRYRKRPLDEVISELRSIFGHGFRHRISRAVSRLGVDLPYFLEKRLIYFIDSNFAADADYSIRLMEALETMDVRWWAHTTVDIAKDDDFLDLMSRSGCIAVNIGFESLSPENLRLMKKPFAGGYDYARAVERIRSRGIGIMGTFVVGFDGENSSIFDEIYQFIEKNRLDWALVFIRTPYPGTRLFGQMEREGRILTRDWEKYDTLHCVYRPLGMSVSELERGVRCVWKRIFSPRSIYRRILKGPRVHPIFYLSMNLQFYNMVRRW